MKSTTLAYHFLALALVPVALWSFKKINKQSFYSHYFRVIEEVESRNSHALDDTSSWWIYGSLPKAISLKPLVPAIFWLVWTLLGLWVVAYCLTYFAQLSYLYVLGRDEVRLALSHGRIPPVRAP